MADLIDILNDLIATCLDSEAAFGKAAKGAHNDNLRTRFTGIARERADFADELAPHVKVVHGWIDLKTGLRPRDDASILEACFQRENNTAHHYAQALSQNLPAAVRAVVERQRLAVETSLAELDSLLQLRKAS